MQKKLVIVLPLILALSLLLVYPVITVSAKSPMSITSLGTFGGTSSFAGDINDRGQVVGAYSDSSGSYAFVWTAKHGKTDLTKLSPTQISSAAYAINDDGQIVGTCTTPNPAFPDPLPNPPSPPYPNRYLPHAVLWTAKNIVKPLEPTIGIVASQPADINNKGQVVGYTMIERPPTPTRNSYSLGPANAFLWTAKTGMTLIPITLADYGAIASTANGINNEGQVVGTLLSDDGHGYPTTYRAFIWSTKHGINLIPLPKGAPATAINTVTDINDKGQVIGWWAEAIGSTRHAFIWSAKHEDSWKAKDKLIEIPALPTAPAESESIPLEINENGEVVGVCTKRGDLGPPSYPPVFERGFLWDAKKGIVELPPLAADTASTARGINNKGEIVGTSVTYELLYRPLPDGSYDGYRVSTTAVLWDKEGKFHEHD